MKGQVLHYDDASGVGQISGADGIRYNFTRADLKRLVPVSAGTEVDFDFEGKDARDIYVVSPAASAAAATGLGSGQTPYNGPIEPDLGFFGYFSRSITSYFANFSGRARRKEYWSFMIVPILIFAVLGIILAGLVAAAESDPNGAGPAVMIVGGIMIIFFLALVIPSLAVGVRRLHDLGQSGWLILILVILGVIPYLGIIASIGYLVLGLIDGQPGANKFGPPVKARA